MTTTPDAGAAPADDRVEPATGAPADRRWTVVAFAAGFAAALVEYFRPYMIGNESVYLLSSRRVFDSDFLRTDWAVETDNVTGGVAVLFDLLLAPVWLVVDNVLVIALLGRVALWVALLLALLWLTRQLGIHPLAFAVGVPIWITSGEFYAAREAVFSSLEQKSLAYLAIVGALGMLLHRRTVAAGIFAGLAIAFHVAVGVWAALALGVVVLVGSDLGPLPRRALRFGLPAAALGAPMLLVVLTGVSDSGPLSQSTIDELIVELRNPHHMDPSYFLSTTRLLAFAPFLVALWYGVTRTIRREHHRVVVPFLATLAALYTVGLAAGVVELHRLLTLMPFRVGDSLLPLFFWLTVPALVAASAPFARLRAVAASFAPQVRPVGTAVVVLCLAVGFVLGARAPLNAVTGARDRAREWADQLGGDDPALEDASGWIRANTPTGAVFAVDPCHFDFWLLAERPMVVNFKTTPVDAEFADWYDRIQALNRGQEPERRGLRICEDLDEHFPRLTAAELAGVQQRFGARYYLVETERRDLRDALVESGDGWWLYEIEELRP